MPFHVNRPDEWVTGRGWAKSSTGWKPAVALWRKSGASTWVMEEDLDTQAPGKPTLAGISTSSANKTIKVTAKMPGDADVNRAVLKYSSTRYPTRALDDSYNTDRPDLTNVKPAGPYQNVTWTWSPDHFDRLYYVSVWAVDDSDNASDRLLTSATIKSAVAAPAPTTPTVSKITYNAVTSGSFDRSSMWWGTSTSYGKLVVQGGLYNYIGGWYYGGKLSKALSAKSKINKMTVKIQRSSSIHGVSAGANVWLVPHKLETVGSGGTPVLSAAASPVKVGTLTRGQTKIFNVPSAWWSGFLSGKYRGLGLYYGSATQWTSYDYMLAYGQGTTSGQVYVEAQ